MAGLIGGNSHYRGGDDPLQDQYAGSAPNANLISIKVANDDGQATTLDAIYGLQFAVDHKDQYNIRVINLSFRSTDAAVLQDRPARRRGRAGLVRRDHGGGGRRQHGNRL